MLKRFLSCLLTLILLTNACCALAQERSIYIPDSFVYEGGTGRVTITCPQVEMVDDQPIATLVFSSPRYTQVTVDGQVYVMKRVPPCRFPCASTKR